MNASFARDITQAQTCIQQGLSLFRDGFLVECHEHMVKALRLQLAAWGNVESSSEPERAEPRTAQEQALLALERSGYRKIERLRAAAQTDDPTSQVTPGHTSAPDVDWIWAEVERLTRFSARQALTPHARKRRRLRRGLFAGALLLLVLFVGYRLWGRPRADASAIYSEAFAAKNAVDGLEATEWLLPDAKAGWVDLVFPAARTVHGVRLINAHNRFSADRAARAVHVTAYGERGSVASVDGAFAHFSETRSVLDLPIEAHDVTRIRVEVLTYFKSGGGLAEIEIE